MLLLLPPRLQLRLPSHRLPILMQMSEHPHLGSTAAAATFTIGHPQRVSSISLLICDVGHSGLSVHILRRSLITCVSIGPLYISIYLTEVCTFINSISIFETRSMTRTDRESGMLKTVVTKTRLVIKTYVRYLKKKLIFDRFIGS